MVQHQNLLEKCKICDKYCNESRWRPQNAPKSFWAGDPPAEPAGEAKDVPADFLVGWGGRYPLPIPYSTRRLRRLASSAPLAYLISSRTRGC